MTIEEKAAAYDTIMKQRDAYIFIIARLIDDIRSGCFNDWDLNREGAACCADYAKKDKLEFHMGPAKSVNDYEKVLRAYGLFHLGRLLRTAEWVELELDKIGWSPAEMVELYKKFDPKEAVAYMESRSSFLKEDKPQELKRLITMLFLTLSECPIGEGLPGEEKSIYHDNIAYAIRELFKHVNVDMNNKEQLMDAIHEYNPKITLAEENEK